MSLKAKPEMLRASLAVQDKGIGVDRENNAILGYVVAEEGSFKNESRGRFTSNSLNRIVEMANADSRGLRSRFQHPSASDDGLGKHLGRAKNFRIDSRGGRSIIRADLRFDQTALEPGPEGGKPLGAYLMDLAESDPGALQTSLVLKPEKIQTDEVDEDGNQLGPVWMPKHVLASDFVADGEAVHGDLLSSDAISQFFDQSDRRLHTELPGFVTETLNRAFPDADREAISSRFQAFLDRYLDDRFGQIATPKEPQVADNNQPQAKVLEAAEPLKPLSMQEFLSMQEALKTQGDAIASLAAELKADRQERLSEKSKTDRAAEISALCQQAGKPNRSTEFISDENLSVEDVRAKLFSELTASLGVGHDSSLEAGGGNAKDPVEELRAKFDERAEQLKKAGYSDRELWVRHQCRDQGIEYRKPE